MSLDNIYGKVISLTKEIYLKKPDNESSYIRKFFVGDFFQRPAGKFGLTWWITKKGLNICDDLAEMIVRDCSGYKSIAHKTLSRTIEEVLRKIVIEEDVFSLDKILFGQIKCLLEGRTIEKEKDFAVALWEEMRMKLNASIISWLVVYPLHKIRCNSIGFELFGLSIVAAKDESRWKEISQRYTEIKYWDPVTGKQRNANDTIIRGPSSSTWLVCEVKGSTEYARFMAGRHMRVFIALLFSSLETNISERLCKSMATPVSYSVQFPDDSERAGFGQQSAHIGVLFPSLLNEIEISKTIADKIKRWNKAFRTASEDRQKRAIAATQFIQYAIISDEIEQYIHFFIALDGLFGERGKTEESIEKRLKLVFPDDTTKITQFKKLYKLRCELVHGGISMIDEWKELEYYRKQYYNMPQYDIATISFTSLLNFWDS